MRNRRERRPTARQAAGRSQRGGDGRVPAMPAAILKSGERPSRRGPARRFAGRSGDPERRGPGRPRGKPRRRPRVRRTDDAAPRGTIGRTAGDAAARGADAVDSAGFRRVRAPGPARRRARRHKREPVRETARRARPGEVPAGTPRGHGRVPADARRRMVENRRAARGGAGRQTPPHNLSRNLLQNGGRGRRGGDAGVSRGTPRRLPQAVAETRRRRERVPASGGKVRGRGAPVPPRRRRARGGSDPAPRGSAPGAAPRVRFRPVPLNTN